MYFYNEVELVGVISEIIFQGDDYSRIKLDVARNEEKIDTLIVSIPKFAYQGQFTLNKRLRVTGSLASPAKLIVYAETVTDTVEEDTNKVYLVGLVYRKGRYKHFTNFSQKTDLTMATKSGNEKAIIPCVVRGRAACWAAKLEEEAEIEVTGRLQSRQYKKEQPDGAQSIMVTYEVLTSSIRRF